MRYKMFNYMGILWKPKYQSLFKMDLDQAWKIAIWFN